jgi:hypothetical protein
MGQQYLICPSVDIVAGTSPSQLTILILLAFLGKRHAIRTARRQTRLDGQEGGVTFEVRCASSAESAGFFRRKFWAAAGSVGTEIGCFRRPEARDGEAKVQSRVQDRGGPPCA